MFVAAIVPILTIERFKDLGFSHEAIVAAAMLLYLGIRFVAIEFFKRYTVHRGMWHSIPAAVSVGLVAYLLMPSLSEAVRIYKSLAVVLGFTVHLCMDEIWSIDMSHGFRLKKSFGTAMKFFSKSKLGNISVYGKLILLLWLAWETVEWLIGFVNARVRSGLTSLSQSKESTLTGGCLGVDFAVSFLASISTGNLRRTTVNHDGNRSIVG